MNKQKAIVGHVSNDPNAIIETVEVLAEVETGGDDGNGELDTELLSVVRNQYGDIALCRRSTNPLNNSYPVPLVWVAGANGMIKMQKILLQLSQALVDAAYKD